ncbi:MAG: PAS-domain containing protein [Sedimentitalea sp.]|uniref:PAS-domain containing protein n=1 Tax=Sedimentitalea sp. TaxID=2048915 RepID=UPI0032647E76
MPVRLFRELPIIELFILATTCILVAYAASRFLASRPSARNVGPQSADDIVWIFDGPDLVDATTRARQVIDMPEGPCFWSDLHKGLSSLYPTFPKTEDIVKISGQLVSQPPDRKNPSEIYCEWIDGITRVSMRKRQKDSAQSSELVDVLSGAAKELETLRFAVNSAHYPVWCVDGAGDVIWFNTAFDTLCQTVLGKPARKDAALFGPSGEVPIPTKRTRRSLTISKTGKKLWFDVSVVQCDAGTLIYAIDVNAIVEAEVAQRNFVQTLAKTFAQLSIGLAIFDRNRQLVLFNPALIDLTALPADFLSARPTILSFFDRLRDSRMMPEPKNYNSWRDQMAELVEAATDGRYQETWSLPSGSVYSVSGRPHPDGAVAFLIEDITAEITLTRRFRSDLEMWQAVFDQIDDAIAVFSLTGDLIFSNAAYHTLWSVDPESSFAQTSILDSGRIWQDQSMASPIWGDIRDFVTMQDDRAEWWARVVLKSGDSLVCSVHPIQRGSTMISFSRATAKPRATTQKQPELTAG